MNESLQLLLVYCVAGPVVGAVLVVLLRWFFQRFPSRTRRDLDELTLRVKTIEAVVEHLSRKLG